MSSKHNVNLNGKSSLTQTRAILSWMRSGNPITHTQCEDMFNCSRLSARIKDIERIIGHKPPRRRITVLGKDAEGNPIEKSVTQYWLDKEDIEPVQTS